MNHEKRSFHVTGLEVRQSGESKLPVLVGHAAVFDVLSRPIRGRFRERIVAGAFARALREKQDVRALIDHNRSKVLGRTTSGTCRLSEDAKGLRVEIDLPSTSYGMDLAKLIRRGDVNQMSFGFIAKREKWLAMAGPDGEDVREVLDVDLVDVSVVTYPAYEEAEVALRSHDAFRAEMAGASTEELDAETAEELPDGDERSCFTAHLGLYAMEPEALRAAVEGIAAGVIKPRADHNDEGVTPDSEEEEEDLRPYEIVGDGVAVVEINGAIMKRSKFGASTVSIRRTLRAAAADGAVRSILLAIESPGGQVAGTKELADDVRAARVIKPVVAHIEDVGASAAYWIASQANVISMNEMGVVGSIGVYQVLEDYSAMFKRAGVKVHVVSTGPNKGEGARGTKISASLLKRVQERVDWINERFTAAVAEGREMSAEDVEALATGEVWGSDKAVETGLVDRIATREEAVVMAETLAAARGRPGEVIDEEHPDEEAALRDVLRQSLEERSSPNHRGRVAAVMRPRLVDAKRAQARAEEPA